MLALKLGLSLESVNGALLNSNTYSLDFNGSTQDANISTVADNINVSQGTVSVWGKLDSVSANASAIKFSVTGVTAAQNNAEISYLNSTAKTIFKYKGNNVTKQVESTTAIENDGKWHHFVLTWDTDADEVKGYLDGVLVGTATGLGQMTTMSGGNVFLARNSINTNSYWNGHLDEAAMFTRVVPIGELYVAGQQPINLTGSSGLIGYWRMEEGTGTSIADSSGNANTGTLTNAPTWSTDTP
jgi:hypothetical protein